MAETQNIEYKSAWRDEYLRWICGFANAQGGTLYIGKDDSGNIVDVPNAQKLLEDIPNKIVNILGITADVNLHKALLNAITHKDYTGCVPIQISVYADKIMMWNEGQLPETWTVKNLFTKHSSRPANPGIANAFFRSGYVEAWGRGIEKITGQCVAAGLPEPVFNPDGSDFWVTFRKNIFNKEDLSRLGLNDRQIDALIYFKSKGEMTTSEYAQRYKIDDRTARRDVVVLVEKKLLSKQGETKSAIYVFS